MELKEIILTTVKESTQNAGEPTQGKQKTVGTLDMIHDVIEGGVRMKLENNKMENSDKRSEFEKLLSNTNDAIKMVADNLSKSFENAEKLTEMEIEFGLSFTEKLGIKIFELSSQQSLKVKIKLQNK